jgi:hypothetical protein
MAAKLEWCGSTLKVGPFDVASVKQLGPRWFGIRVPSTAPSFDGTYEREDDAKQDAEIKVRRLLKEAGVDLA